MSAKCTECGATIPEGSPGGFCSKCLLELALNEVQSSECRVQSGAREGSDRFPVSSGQSPEEQIQPDKRSGNDTVALMEKPGDRIGRYKLLEEIGHGGCGVVYMAEQENPVKRKVALKVIKLGMDTRQVVARFEAERQALALMDHPNIARIYDAGMTDTPLPASGYPLRVGRGEGQGEGQAAPATRPSSLATSAGRPYFVMELVGGIKITDYCEQNALNTRQRLDLFIQVCRAIQHAHQKGVIHRDIKPSNVLVATQDGVPVPKVIDFGISKATQGRLTDQTVFTAFEQFIGTPAYMSPEQAQLGGLDVDTRSDIYSLGVLLYELLTGKTPFDSKELLSAGLEAMRRTICEKEPPTPSTRLKQDLGAQQAPNPVESKIKNQKSKIANDLDWIVMKCLEKDRARRYETANGLATDIERHLKHEPVVAGPPSGLYRFQKLLRRNRVLTTSVGAVALVLTLGVIVSTWLAVRATRAEREQIQLRQDAQAAQANETLERGKAQREAEGSQQVAKFLKDMLGGIDPSVAMGRDTSLLREILDKTAERLPTDLTSQPAVEAELRDTLGRVYLSVGEREKAEQMHRRALEIRSRTFGEQSAETARSLDALAGTILDRVSSLPIKLPKDLEALQEAEALERQALSALENLTAKDDVETAEFMSRLGRILREEQKPDEAEDFANRSLEMQRRLLGNDHPQVAQSLQDFGELLADRRRFDDATRVQKEALAIQLKLFGGEHPKVATALHRLGRTLFRAQKYSDAEQPLREALALKKKLLGVEHPSTEASLAALADVLFYQGYPEGNLKEPEMLYKEDLELRRRIFGANHMKVASTLDNLVKLYSSWKKPAEAEPFARESLGIRMKLLGEDDLERVDNPRIELARILEQQGKVTEAEKLYADSFSSVMCLLGETNWATAIILKQLSGAKDYHKGWMHEYGRDGTTNIAEAINYYRKAAAEGHYVSQETLADIYQEGRGVWPDEEQAKAWRGRVRLPYLRNSGTASPRNIETELRSAEKAADATARRNPLILDSLAAVYAKAGQLTNAVSTQKEAIALLTDADNKADFGSRLEHYELSLNRHQP